MCTVLIFTVDAFATVKSLRIPTFNPSIFTSAANLSNKETMYLATSEHILPIALRYATYVYFTLDILLRVISAQSARHYFKSLLNIVDVVWVVVNWSLIAVSNLLGVKWLYMSASEVRVFTGLVMVVMLLRIFRIYRFGQHYIPLRVLLLTMKGSSTEVGLLFLLLCTGAMVFGPLIYVAELGNDNSFMYNILIGYWWAVVTMTTVGYGDIYPVDVPGYFVGILCVIVGLGFISLPMSVISTNFSKYREFARTFGARKRSVDRYLYQSSTVSPSKPAKDDQMAENDEKQTI
ncbi:potassium voltage-gated channel subfamily C member 4-like [Lingula anatina]|uniref:Potassium voltage-gated channel subfamily C member 4-like n=1 Tax=Lingula anatina TaxID=7574 RepID=A0A1S3H3T1_LINAN|nr:potassium voltage-gated channel subfamily C member 4-like [Lingula anatina]|eukprot:XP_013380663.1 potassium voltage-gated channel subfamily C member 4-like [Lingula anatina]